MTPRSVSSRYRQIIEGFKRVRLVVVGDLVADEFIYGRIDRVSREAPVLILKYDSTEIVPGGAGNAAANAATLGARVEVIGVVGGDSVGDRLLEAMPEGAGTRRVGRAAGYVTPVKTRILAGGVHSAKQQVVRIDRAGGPLDEAARRAVGLALRDALAGADAVIVSDYGGALDVPAVWRKAWEQLGRRKRPLVFVDSRYGLGRFAGMTACTPNESEVESLLGVKIDDDRAVLERAGRALLDKLACEAVLITRGSRGMALFEPRRRTDHIPIVGSDEVADVTGAGDTVIATFSLAAAAGASFAEAARLANHAGGLVVMKRGTATVGADELSASVARSFRQAKGGQSPGAPRRGKGGPGR